MKETNKKLIDPIVITQWINKRNWNEVKSYLDAIPLDKYRSWEYMAKGLVQEYREHNLQSSKKSLDIACQLSSHDANFYYTYSDILLKLNKNTKSLEFATKSVSIAPNNPMCHLSLAYSSIANSQYDKAFKAAKEASQNISSKQTALKKQIETMLKRASPIWNSPLKGKNIILLRIEPRHKEFLLQTRRNSEFQHHYNLFINDSERTLMHDIEVAQKPPLDTRKIDWIIERNNKSIGIASLAGLDMHNRTAEILVGLPEKKSFKDSLEATLLVLEFAFCKINLHKLVSYVYSDNPIAQRNTMHLGFEQEGFQKSQIYDIKSNTRLDLYINGCLTENFFRNKKLMKMSERLIGRDLSPKKLKYSKLNIIKGNNIK